MTDIRMAFTGASATGKSTLANYVVDTCGVPLNPVGSRSVSKAMGFDSPYDVDKAGKRAEFQRRLVTEKCAWENDRSSFVTDRTTLDNLVYTLMHDVHSIDAELLDSVVKGLHRYTHIFYCPVDVFCDPGNDPARIKDMTYHKLYDVTLKGFLDEYVPSTTWVHTVSMTGAAPRKEWLHTILEDFGVVHV